MATKDDIPSHFIFKRAKTNQQPFLFIWQGIFFSQRLLATASSLLISTAIREMIPQHSESSQRLTTATIPDGENISDHNGPSCQCLLQIVLGTAGDRRGLVACRDLQSNATHSTSHTWKSVAFLYSHNWQEKQRGKRRVRPSETPSKK